VEVTNVLRMLSLCDDTGTVWSQRLCLCHVCNEI